MRMLTFILASQSPRRRDLLTKAGFSFHTYSLEISEILNENLSLDDALMELAGRKSDAIVNSDKLAEFEDILVLTADTVVVLDDEVIGKPSNLDDAMVKLRRLSGRNHIVKTAVQLAEFTKGNHKKAVKADACVETSEVFFKELSEEEIKNYVQTHKPLDKAGAYGIQDLPKGFITSIKGNLDNVMGLPVTMVEEMLGQNGWNVPRRKNKKN